MPFEYTLVRKEETMLGVKDLLDSDVERLRSEGADIPSYLQELDREIEEHPQDVLPYVKKSLLLQKNDPSKAIDTIERGLEEVGENHLLYHSRAMMHEFAGRRDMAISDLRRAIEIYPIAIETLYILGTLLNRDGRHEDAIIYWDRVLEMDPRDSFAWNGKMTSERRLGDDDRALKHTNAAIFCNPETPAFYGNRGMILLEMGRVDEAFEDFDTQAKLGDRKGAASSLKQISSKYMQSGDVQGLLRVYEKALELDPENIDTLTGLCGVYATLDRVEDFERTVERTVEIAVESDDLSHLAILDQLFSRFGKDREAARIQERLYEIAGAGKKDHLAIPVKSTVVSRGLSGIDSTVQNPLEEKPGTTKREEKIGRNDPCPCGSGLKHKRCCGKH
jgi:tetratricopeptide (TPR) repeat protein